MLRLWWIVGVLALAGCGEEEVEAPAAPPQGSTRLEVEVRPDGRVGPVERHVVTEAPQGVTRKDFEPVPRNVACTEIYGGPQTARVTGTLRGEPVDARFSRTDGCQIARWDAVADLLGPAPGPVTPLPRP